MALNLPEMADAVRTWLDASTGLQVILLAQNATRPSENYVAFKLYEGGRFGGVSEIQHGPNPAPTVGAEVEVDVKIRKELVATIQAYTVATEGTQSAVYLLGKASAEIELPARRKALRDAGLVIANVGSVQDVGALIETRNEGRAALEVRFNATDLVSEFTTYIETAPITGTTKH